MVIFKIVLIWLLLTFLINSYLMTLPKLDFKKGDFPEKFLIQQKNKIDIQNKYECAAFSTAYVLRHLGKEADGFEVYANIPSKMKTGHVYPKGIRTYLKQEGFETSYYKGNIHTLKMRISKGHPVIAFIKVDNKSNELHYVPVIGYDNDYLYIAESLEFLINCKEQNAIYNRKVAIGTFKHLWDTKKWRMPFYSNTYITINM